jgi:hypothetical protein
LGISATRTSKNKGVAPPLHPESPKPKTRNVKVLESHFNILATKNSKDEGLFSSTASGNPETRNVKSDQNPFPHFSYREFKRQEIHSSTTSGNPET